MNKIIWLNPLIFLPLKVESIIKILAYPKKICGIFAPKIALPAPFFTFKSERNL